MQALKRPTTNPISRKWWLAVLAAALACSRAQPAIPLFPAPLSQETDSTFRVPCELTVQRAAAAGTRIYRESEVNDHAEPVPINNRGPRYPNEKTRAVPATVIVEFVVDSTGAVDLATFRPLEAGPRDFLVSVRNFLATAAFKPARIAGHRVPQCLKQTFQFVPTYYNRAGEH
jgi:hypothetical protein